MLLLSGHTQLRQRRLILARSPRPHLDERQRFSVVAHQINLAFHFSRHIISLHKNISMPSQIPISKGFAATQPSPRAPLHRLKNNPRRISPWPFLEACAEPSHSCSRGCEYKQKWANCDESLATVDYDGPLTCAASFQIIRGQFNSNARDGFPEIQTEMP